jgi:acetate kinase
VVRRESLQGLHNFGIVLDEALNQKRSRTARCISAATSKVKVFVIPTNEELAIARETARLVGG